MNKRLRDYLDSIGAKPVDPSTMAEYVSPRKAGPVSAPKSTPTLTRRQRFILWLDDLTRLIEQDTQRIQEHGMVPGATFQWLSFFVACAMAFYHETPLSGLAAVVLLCASAITRIIRQIEKERRYGRKP